MLSHPPTPPRSFQPLHPPNFKLVVFLSPSLLKIKQTKTQANEKIKKKFT